MKKKREKTRKRMFEESKGSEKHEKVKEKMRHTSKRIFEESKVLKNAASLLA